MELGFNAYSEKEPGLTEKRTCSTMPAFEVQNARRGEDNRETWRPGKGLMGSRRDRAGMVALKVANKVPKGVKTTPFWQPGSGGNALFCQRVTSCCQNCKTFMRRFDPGPRLQYFSM